MRGPSVRLRPFVMRCVVALLALWSQEVRADPGPLVLDVYVPLCDGALIACGRGGLGEPRNLAANLYWGAMYGAERFLSRATGFRVVTRVDAPESAKPGLLRVVELERAAARGERVVRVVLRAYAGDRIDDALRDFLGAVGGASSADLVVWAGHDRLMDVPAPSVGVAAKARPSAVLACSSERWFKPVLDAAGSVPVVHTRTFMAPEAYLLEALASAVAAHGVEARREIRRALVEAYAKYQRISPKAASSVFSTLGSR